MNGRKMNGLATFLTKEKNVERATYIWNMAGSLLNAFQSVIFLMIITRVLGIGEAGIFTIAYADANLFLNLGKYGMRYFQVSDYQNQFSFRQYVKSRYLTVLLMVSVSWIYVFTAAYINSYSFHKVSIILWMCVWKAADALEDVFHGDLQKCGRLDIAGKMLCTRVVSMTVVWALLLMLTKNQMIATVIAAGFTFFITIRMIYLVRSFYSMPLKVAWNDLKVDAKMLELLRIVFPLFLSMFLSFYIGNAPRYAIDRQLSDELQACYGFIAMPVFVIGLLSSFIFNPIITRMSVLWNESKNREFGLRAFRQMVIVLIITGVCMAGAYILGIPVLSWIYHTDLSDFKVQLMLMLVGGGFLGLSGLLQMLITIQRGQRQLVIIYIFVTVIAIIFSNGVVREYGMNGAVCLYILLMGLLCIGFVLIFIRNLLTNRTHTTIEK